MWSCDTCETVMDQTINRNPQPIAFNWLYPHMSLFTQAIHHNYLSGITCQMMTHGNSLLLNVRAAFHPQGTLLSSYSNQCDTVLRSLGLECSLALLVEAVLKRCWCLDGWLELLHKHTTNHLPSETSIF